MIFGQSVDRGATAPQPTGDVGNVADRLASIDLTEGLREVALFR